MKRLVLFCIYSFLVCHYAGKPTAALVDPDAYRNVSELITSKGYPLEEHTVLTSDGYVLSMQRIPHGKNNNTESGDKEVVLLLHGELGDGKTWFLNPPGQGLGYILPDAGYDVWILNNRGSTYSQKNIYYPTRSYKFWNFTFEDMAKYDVPPTIDYILEKTGKESLHIVGYSRGNTVGFVLLSEVPEYNEKVKLLVALAPIAYIGHFKTAVRYFIPFANVIATSINLVSQGEFLPDNKATRIITAKFCEVQDVELCQSVLFAVAGQDRAQLNETRVPIYSAQYPSSTSTKILLHFAQLYKSKKFRKFDYGSLRNRKYYNQRQPPDYRLSNIKSPVALFWSENDKIADPKDVGILRSQLNSIVFDYKVPGDQYNHFDFIWAKDSQDLIYKPLLDLLAQY